MKEFDYRGEEEKQREVERIKSSQIEINLEEKSNVPIKSSNILKPEEKNPLTQDINDREEDEIEEIVEADF